jgi:membrane protein YqaA with SNARE-associated domain
MRLFSALYNRTMQWSRHRHAPWFLGVLSFAESSFFPIPPDVMLAPMALARPERAWVLAALTMIMSVLGGLFGYLIGYFAFELVAPLIQHAGYWPAYLQAREWFAEWGFWAIFIAAFTPIPYKMFTIASGVISMALLPFVLGSLIGRGARLEGLLRKYVGAIGWSMVALAVAAYFILSAR